MRSATFLSLSAVLTFAMIGHAEPVLKFRPDSYAIHQMHSHHLAATHHADVLRAYSGDAASIPHDVMSGHLKLIRREVTASRKSLARVPEAKIAETNSAEAFKAVQKSQARAIKSVKAISEEIAKEQPDHEKIQEHAKRISEALSTGETHIHTIHAAWQQSTIHRRLHPGT
jgi:hypothetical protein